MASKLLSVLLDLLYPPRCMLCHRLLERNEENVCPACMGKLPEHDGPDPKVRFASQCVATFFYEDELRTSFHRFKFGGLRQYAAQYARWMAVTVRDKLDGKYDLITWVPISKTRFRERGYDQSRLLCEELSALLQVPCVQTLTKQRHTRPQSTAASREERAANALGSYAPVCPENFAGKRILLIDDIVTTGATLGECCRILRTAGAEDVVCAALATPRE